MWNIHKVMTNFMVILMLSPGYLRGRGHRWRLFHHFLAVAFKHFCKARLVKCNNFFKNACHNYFLNRQSVVLGNSVSPAKIMTFPVWAALSVSGADYRNLSSSEKRDKFFFRIRFYNEWIWWFSPPGLKIKVFMYDKCGESGIVKHLRALFSNE